MLKSLKKIVIKDRNRVGRGISAGQGKTAGRGTKGQKSRSGYNIPRKFEGGQMPFSMRMPKVKGFKSDKPKAVVLSLTEINLLYKAGETVSYANLVEKKVLGKGDKVKVLNNGQLDFAVTFEVPYSKSIQIPVKKAVSKTEEVSAKPEKKVVAKSEAVKVKKASVKKEK